MEIIPFLWYNSEAEEAAHFYASLLPDSHVDSVTDLPAETPSGPPGSVKIVEFTLLGRPFQAMSAGPLDNFNHAFSLVVLCDTQEEIDRLWKKLGEGGAYEECGWLRDRYGVCWQITPRSLEKMIRSPDRAAAKRAVEAMLEMKKLDIAAMERAFAGNG